MDALAMLSHLARVGTAGPGIARAIDVGTEPFLRFFEEEILQDMVEAGGAAVRLYQAEYGGGKTHLLQLIEEVALDRGCAVVRADLSADLQLSDWPGLMQHVLSRMQVRSEDGSDRRALPDILAWFTWEEAASEDLRTLQVPHTGFRDAMRLAAFRYDDRAPDSLRRFLLGETVRISELQRDGIRSVKGAISKRNAERVLQTLGACLRALGIPGLVILFDETEQMIGRPGSPRTVMAANLLRRIIDGSTTGRLKGTFVGMAVLPGTIQNASITYPALGQRLRATERSRGGYRRPVLDIAGVNECTSSKEFLDGAVDRVLALAVQAGCRRTDLRDRLMRDGLTVLEQHVSGYRRPLFKQLANTALEAI